MSMTQVEAKVKQELMQKFNAGLLHLFDNETDLDSTKQQNIDSENIKSEVTSNTEKKLDTSDYMAPWIDSEECTACDECIKLNPEIFAYDENKHATIKNPDAGPYSDLVKAAERCTAQVIHPGLPRDRNMKDVDKWIKRAEKYNA
jgi:pyruvate-ferredoxin/flavodoxin oxidoreductase